jgi:hypothetical protein
LCFVCFLFTFRKFCCVTLSRAQFLCILFMYYAHSESCSIKSLSICVFCSCSMYIQKVQLCCSIKSLSICVFCSCSMYIQKVQLCCSIKSLSICVFCSCSMYIQKVQLCCSIKSLSICVFCSCSMYIQKVYCITASSRERVSELEQELETLKLNLLNVQQSNLKVNNMKATLLYFIFLLFSLV